MQQALTKKSLGIERAVHLRLPRELYVELRVEALKRDVPFGAFCVAKLQSPPAAAPAQGSPS